MSYKDSQNTAEFPIDIKRRQQADGTSLKRENGAVGLATVQDDDAVHARSTKLHTHGGVLPTVHHTRDTLTRS